MRAECASHHLTGRVSKDALNGRIDGGEPKVNVECRDDIVGVVDQCTVALFAFSVANVGGFELGCALGNPTLQLLFEGLKLPLLPVEIYEHSDLGAQEVWN